MDESFQLGDYLVDKSADGLLGTGSFGKVYRATHIKTGTVVAAKQLDPESRGLQSELLLQQRGLRHDNVVTTLDCIMDELLHPWLFMELCEGNDLNAWVRANFQSLTRQTRLHIGVQAARGLHFLHEQDFVHRY